MGNKDVFQPTLELLSTQVAAIQMRFLREVLKLFTGHDKVALEQLNRDLLRFLDSLTERGINREVLSDLMTVTELVARRGCALFQGINVHKVTGSITQISTVYHISLSAAAIVFYTRNALEPVRVMLQLEE